MRPRTPQHQARRLGPALSGAIAAAAIGLGCGEALKPTPEESGLPRPPQLMHLSEVELAVLERIPSRLWPSVPAPWRT
ncbi:hypothetical protein [Phenylobacterium sp.]|jgi:hypothetical protein|uniref:hypothetical protein n=1 Tax=Phenylobacterium sp. TaxID=1871053 RepID=UPI002E37097F|nr:hypothetical protein [Phenylobacterium sp.]HEX2561989.1 hypothetical protein [Phenylobacterium sp.]